MLKDHGEIEYGLRRKTYRNFYRSFFITLTSELVTKDGYIIIGRNSVKMSYNLGNVYVVAKMFVDFSGRIAPEVNVPEIIRLAQNSEPIQIIAGAACAGMKNVEPKEIVRYLNRKGYDEKGA